MRFRSILPLAGTLITLGCLVLAAYAVDWRQTVGALARIRPNSLAFALLFLIATLFLFALRWRELIAAEHRPTLFRTFNFLMVGYLANAILPARPGDIIRAVLLRQISGISLSIGLASIVLERLLDVLAICTLGVMVSFTAPLPALVAAGLYGLATAGLGLLAVLILLGWRPELIGELAMRFPAAFSHATARFLAEWLKRFATATRLFNSPARLTASIVLTCLGWGALVLAVMMLLEAFRVPAPPAAAPLVVAATNLGAIVPSSPGSLGVYHVMAVVALSVWNVDISTAAAFAIGSHALAILLQIVLGISGAWFEGIGAFGLTRIARSDLVVTTQKP